MADDLDSGFNPSMKKKKKKTKKIVDFDPTDEVEEKIKNVDLSNNQDTNKENEIIEEANDKQIDDDMNFDDFSSMKKKKKKKPKKGFEEDTEITNQDDVVENNGVDENNLVYSKKKKKRREKVQDSEIKPDKVDDEEDTAPAEEEKEYTYEELLTRVFDTMKAKNPDAVAGEKRKFIMRPPQVFKIGTKKTSFANFGDICKILHRQPKHLLAYLLAELGTSGSIDSNNQLIIKGRFQQKQIESVLRRYIKEYVTCHTCRSPDTILQKETRLFFLQCETCGSRCSVASIKSGFQALTGRRAALKSKQQ
ncbi:eukaryotic translation initiation factor 2 subunit 2-like [Xenia sp. Carnegie-2017]|uniref:eukaryotic translation initiation factor 2 subunit 2-like n=1 Tax=Xenia sp. Carnegie-2017 TaxID=2897299 RepID=UPI001F04D370|nr:eukaryotic translation initiation factor 2 subunit 2-like [Xenia sp. Carnegie-2017]